MSHETSWEIKTVSAEEAQFTLDTVQRLINNSELAKIARESNILTAAGFHHATWMLATHIIEATANYTREIDVLKNELADLKHAIHIEIRQ